MSDHNYPSIRDLTLMKFIQTLTDKDAKALLVEATKTHILRESETKVKAILIDALQRCYDGDIRKYAEQCIGRGDDFWAISLKCIEQLDNKEK